MISEATFRMLTTFIPLPMLEAIIEQHTKLSFDWGDETGIITVIGLLPADRKQVWLDFLRAGWPSKTIVWLDCEVKK